uniref:Uncharacterized protein LOC108038149 n=1 Tax=Drosophila rhopaloa TaxID=1041015 RepID=A0A6P4E1V5_DRORH
MAEKKTEEDNKSLRSTASSSSNRPSRLEVQNRRQEQNNALIAQLYASLESEHRKLKDLEQRRSKLTEEMKNLRALLLAENQRRKQTVALVPGNPIPSGSQIAKTPPEKSSTSRADSIKSVKSMPLERRASTKSVTIAEPPTPNLAISKKPRASSVQSFQKKGNRRSLKAPATKNKRRITLGNISNTREDMLSMTDEITSVGSNLRTLEHRRSNQEAQEDMDEVLVSLPALFTLLDAQTESIDTQFADQSLARVPATEAPLSLLNSDQDPNFYLPSANSLFQDLLGYYSTPPISMSAPLTIDLPEVLPSIGISECSAIVAEVDESETEADLQPTIF